MPSRFDPPHHLVRDIVGRALAEDLGSLGDLTAALFDQGVKAGADIVPRKPGILAGSACATEVFAQLDPNVMVSWSAADGDPIVAGAPIAHLEGPLASIVTGERTALNFLCHLSGVATLTRTFADRAAVASGGRARVWDTRKTLPGLRAFEKAAVAAGGGTSHRGSLSEMVLVKDNHLMRMSVADAVARAEDRWPGRGIEIECDRIEQVAEAVAAGATMVLLDNMTPEQVRECVDLVGGRLLVEVSGGITLETVGAYAAAGADLISTSVITQSAPALDLGLDLIG